MVGAFCESHKIPCPATEDRNTALDVICVGGVARGVADSVGCFKNGDFVGGTLHLANAPLRGVNDSLGCAVKTLGKIFK